MRILFAAAAFAIAGYAQAAAVSVGTDLLGSSYTHFNGFEGTTGLSRAGTPYTEGGITVSQINGDPGTNAIWLMNNGQEGARSWYANGGDQGYTRIALADGTDFDAVSILTYNGFGGSTVTLNYELRDNGSFVASGNALQYGDLRISVLGGGFDEIWLTATFGLLGSSVQSGAFQALMVDSIKAVSMPVSAVPLPAAAWMFGSALLGMFGWKRRAKREAAHLLKPHAV